jgi:HNH endonuclease
MTNYKAMRLLVTDRAYGCCEYCMSQEKFSSQSFSMEHIVPKAIGGSDEPYNLAFGSFQFKLNRYRVSNSDSLTILFARFPFAIHQFYQTNGFFIKSYA